MCENCDLHYLAATIDCEGCIGIYPGSNRGRGYYDLRVFVCNSDVRLIHYIQTKFGGSFRLMSRTNITYKDMYSVGWCGKKAKDILRLVLDILVIKKERAELFLGFPFEEGKNGLSDATKSLREQIYIKMKELNKKGSGVEIIFGEPIEHEQDVETIALPS